MVGRGKMEYKVWDLLNVGSQKNETKFALLILNQSLKPQLNIFEKLWKKASFKVTVDGGTNELYDNSSRPDLRLPDIITGDFDSAREEVLQFYKDKGVEVIQTEDQNFTDFTKCLKIVSEKPIIVQIQSIVVLGAFGGRLDHIFGNINALFTADKLMNGIQVYLLSNENMACLLQKGRHLLKVDSGFEGAHCGLIPVGGVCECVTTTGLKWNLNRHVMQFGGLISACNTWAPEGNGIVTVETDNPILWTMSVK